MKRFIKRYWAVSVSLLVLFASGIAAGFRWGQHQSASVSPDDPKAGPGTDLTAEQWAENAAAALQKDLGLSESQTDRVRETMAGSSRDVFLEKRRGDFQIHLRLLEVHDKLAKDVDLSDTQKATLRVRREQLKQLIVKKFPDLIGPKPDPRLNDL